MSAVELQAGPRTFLVAGRRVEAGALFTVELAVAADLVAQGCACAVDTADAAAVASYRKAEHDALVRKIESETRSETRRAWPRVA